MFLYRETRMEGIKVIAFAANKGGVGKTREAILTANCCGAAGKRVLVIDMDFNDSAGFYYKIPTEDSYWEKLAESKNIAAALSKDTNDLNEFAIETIRKNVRLIPSSRYMSDIRAVNERRLSRMIGALRGSYDIVIIDCKPDYDNIVLNAINAADAVITPVQKDLDSYNAAVFLDQKLSFETDKRDCWEITVNGYNRRYENAVEGRQREYLDLFENHFFNKMTPRNTWFPWTPDMNEIKDRKRLLSEDTPVVGEDGQKSVCNKTLYDAAVNLARHLTGEELEKPEAF
jgi:chromosome partitioning protein